MWTPHRVSVCSVLDCKLFSAVIGEQHPIQTVALSLLNIRVPEWCSKSLDVVVCCVFLLWEKRSSVFKAMIL